MAKSKPGAIPGTEVKMRKPRHGGGLLKIGGTIGPGRPPSEIRRLMTGDFLATRQEIAKYMENAEPCSKCGRKVSLADLTRLGEFFGRFGPGPAKGSLDPAVIAEMAAAVLRHADISDEAMQAIYRDWALTLGRSAAGE